MKKQIKLLSIIAGFVALGVASSQASDKALVDTLVKKGFITSSEAAEISKGTYGSVNVKEKTTNKLTLSGRLQFQYDNLSADSTGAVDPASTNNFYFRRLFLGTKASIAQDWDGEIVLDFGDQELGFDKAVATYKGIDFTKVSFGFAKVPFGYEETSSSSKIPTIERSAANRVFADDYDFAARHSGIFVSGDVAETGFKYAGALVNTAQSFSTRKADQDGSSTAAVPDTDAEGANQFGVYGRLQYKGDLAENGKFTIGVDGGYQSESPAFNDATKTSAERGAAATAFTGYVDYHYEGFNVLGEYFTGEWENGDAAGRDAGIDAFSIRVSYLHDKTWEPVIRYSYVEADNKALGNIVDYDELIRRAPENTATNSGDELESWYIGLNYHMVGHAVKFMGGYEMAEGERQGGAKTDIQGFRARVQVLF